MTAVERNTRFTLVGRTDTKEANEVTSVLCAMFLQVPETARTGTSSELRDSSGSKSGRQGLKTG